MGNKFEADTGKILDIVINSLYSEREIFVRELISNASDAIDKKKYLSLTDKSINDTTDPFEIKIEVDSKNNTLKIADNGIGMDDLIASLMQLASLNGNQVSYALSSFSKCMYNLIVWTNHMCGVMAHVQNNTAQHENCHMNL